MSEEVRELEEQATGAEAEATEESVANPSANSTDESQQTQQQQVVIPDDYNWDNHPGFRDWKRKMSQEQAAERQRFQQELNYYRSQLEQVQTAEMDDYQREAYARQQAELRASAAEAELNRIQAEQARRDALRDISEATGAPLSALNEAQNYQEALRLAASYRKNYEREQSAKAKAEADAKAKARAQRAEANRPDTGGPSAPPSGMTAAFKDAKTSKDLARLFWQQP